MRRIDAFCAALSLAASAIAVTSPAQAAFHLIRWDGNGFCQVWDESAPTQPWPAGYKVVTKPVATFGDAIAVKDGMLKKGSCKF
jgi:hypothetical protein